MSVHYKFKSNINYDTVTFDGLHISVSDLKKSIMQQKKIGKSSDFDLQITNAQTKEVYDNDETLVPKNTSVIVARVPVVSNNKKAWEKPELPLPIDDGDKSGHIRFDKMVKSADIANTNATEDDKVKAMITQSSQEYDPSKYVKSRSMTGPLPPLYTCFRCGKQGHWIKNCPTNNLDIKRSTGIPRSFMVPVDGPEHKGALLTSSGDYAVPIIDHHAYKEVKKEKPPFVFEPEAAPEPEAEIPEELLCMFCKSLLQEAVLIPCCGNSFCDECVRQALLDSDSHECPVCHEIDISPDTVIPNRFLRTAVMNFKNETGYTRVRKMFQPTPPPPPAPHLESPQPSPDSTVENQPVPDDNNSSDIKYEIPEPVKEESVETIKKEVEDDKVEIKQEATEEPIDDTTPPGTPLADEPVEDDTAETLPVQQDGLNDYDDDSQSERYHRSHRSRDDDYHYESQEDDSEPRQISTIETITTRQRFGGRSLPPLQTHHRPPYSVGMQHRDRQNDYEPQGRDFRGRYDRRNNNERQPMRGHRPQRYDMNQNDRYHRHENRRGYGEYPSESRHTRESHYDHPPPPLESRRPPLRYASPPPPVQPAIAPTVSVPIPVPAQLDVTPQYHVPAAVPTSQPPVALLPTPQTSTFPPQPPPPGASPVDHSSHIPPQPPPPGVGPLPSIPLLPDPPSSFPGSSFKSEEVKPKQEEPSIDDRMEAFQRELDKRASESVRDRASRSSSRSRKRSRSSTRSSHSRSYSSSKSWSRTSSRSLSRSSRSRSRSSYSSRSRSRSYSRSRSRSRSKSRSYSRSRSRSLVVRQRSKSRSRSRDRDWEKRRGSPRDRQNINYSKKHSPSSSPPPRNYHPRNRNSPYSVRRPYNQPVPYSGTSYTAPYVAPTSLMPVPVLRTAQYVPSHLHPTHPIQPPPVTHPHPIEHYPMERTRYPYNELQYAGYNAYQHPTKTYGHQRYEREPRTQRYEPPEYQREYPRREEEGQRIQGWIGDRDREYKPRLRPARDQRKEVKELPKISEPDMKSEIRVRETREKQDFVSKKRDDTSSRRREETNERKKEESSGKQKEERQSAKHKKHHHHHRSKESRKTEKQESKIPVVITADATQDPAANLINVKVMPNTEIETKKIKQEHDKPPDKMKEKKHKHKKHKIEDQLTKKKKVPKKEKLETSENSEQNLKAKNKKKKSKVKALMKALEETRKKEKLKHSKKIKIEKEIEEPEIKVEQTNDPDVLTVMAEDLKLEPENPESGAELHHPEDVIKLNASTEDIELDLGVAEEPGVEHEKPELDSEEPENKPSESQTPSEVVASEAKEVVDDADPLEEEEEVEEGEADDEGAVQEEDELHVEVPELSKWEREEYEDEVISKPQRRSAVFVPRDKKGISTLSSDIIQRAENVIMQKPLKTAIIHAASSNGKEKVKSEKRPASKTASPVDSTSSRHSELKNITERSRSPNLQVTINTEKEKRSVQTKDETQQQPKRIKLDRSSFKSIELSKPTNTSHRTVIVEEPLIPVKKSDEKHQRKVESRSLASKHPKIHGPDYKGDNETKSSSSRSAKENIKIVSDRKHDNRRSHSREDKKREVSSRDRYSTRETIDFPRAQKEVRSVVTDFDQSKRYAQSSRSAAPLKDTRKRRSRSRSYDSTEYQQHSSSKRQYITTDTRRHEHYSSQDHNERHRRAKSPVDSSPTQNQKRSQSRKYSTVKVSSTRGERFSNTYDESKFEPDYDDDSDSRQAIREKNKPKRTSVIAGSSSHKQPKSSDVERHRKAEKRKTASSTSSPSSSSSASDSDDSSDEKTVKQKVDVEHKRHKKSKHKKHRKHKHKKRKSHKPKLKS